jgi:pyruvate dehydrogenase E1 component alpha subunit
MHFADLKHGNVGAMGIVGAGVGLGAGVALSLLLRKEPRVVAAFCGDGAMNEGVVFEAMNLAAVWQLPLIVVCENNQYGEYTAGRSVSAGEGLSPRAAAFGIPTASVDGMNVEAVWNATTAAAARARAGQGPTFLECETYRYSGHHVGDLEKYRTKEEVETWRQRDPIDHAASALRSLGLQDAELDAINSEAEASVATAVAFARSSPFPDPSELEHNVYVN